ncbi:unnamed protein product [Polarella glacialis]|uniref:Amino acid transporter transmembrane domain-containing protein n=1 Tax=Polarella glacialis TaxID=89957 RepID=A0A813F5R8_POLGL|nr:unnamed protein product [Polarella glacialis]
MARSRARHSAPAASGARDELLTFRPSLVGLPSVARLSLGGETSTKVLLVSSADDARQLTAAEGFLVSADGRCAESSHVQPWPATAALIVAEVVGTGVLGLGAQISVLGLPAGLLILCLCYPINLFASLLLSHIHQALPGVVTFGDALGELLGPRAACWGYGVLYVYLFMTMTNYMIVLSDSIQMVLYWIRVCRPAAGLVGALLLVPTNQLRSLSGLTWLSAISFGTILGTLGICIWELLGDDPNCSGEVRQAGFLQYAGAVSGFVFAFAGQQIMLEMQAEMSQPSDFPKAVYLAFSLLFVVYLIVCILSYNACGDGTPGELLLVLPEGGGAKSVAGMLMVVHLIISYTILQQVFNRGLCIAFMPGALEQGPRASAKWFAVTSCSMIACVGLAVSIPLFQDIVSFTGSLLSTQCSFIIPPVLFLAAKRRQSQSEGGQLSAASLADKLAVGASVGLVVMGGCLMIVGTISSLVVLAENLRKGGNSPLSCHALANSI